MIDIASSAIMKDLRFNKHIHDNDEYPFIRAAMYNLDDSGYEHEDIMQLALIEAILRLNKTLEDAFNAFDAGDALAVHIEQDHCD